MRVSCIVLVCFGILCGGCDDSEQSERDRLYSQLAELQSQRLNLLPELHAAQADLAGALNGREPSSLTVAEIEELRPYSDRFEAARRAVLGVDISIDITHNQLLNIY